MHLMYVCMHAMANCVYVVVLQETVRQNNLFCSASRLQSAQGVFSRAHEVRAHIDTYLHKYSQHIFF